jgi:hypothetical protein
VVIGDIGGNPAGRTTFPIFDTPYDQNGRIRRINVIGGIAAPALAVIERLQPYHRGQSALEHPLSLIGALYNTDKHRYLLTVAQWVPHLDQATFGPPREALGITDPNVDTRRIYILPRPLRPHEDMHMHLQAALFVSLQEPPGLREKDVIHVLEELIELVRHSVIPGFEPFFN